MSLKIINLQSIRIDGNTQARTAINNELVDEYAAAMSDGGRFPEIECYFDGVDYWLVDGFHRLHAMNKLGKASATVMVFNGTLREAVLHSLGVNAGHGLRKSNDDKRKSVQTMLNDAEWRQLSDREIAKHCGCSKTLVGQMRNPKPVEQKDPTAGVGGNITTPAETEHQINQALAGVSPALAATENVAAKVEPEAVEPPDYTELDAAQDLISDLQSELVVARMGDIPDGEKQQAANLIAELRAEIQTLTATNRALILSRDSLMEEVAQMKKQMAMQRKEIDKLKNNR